MFYTAVLTQRNLQMTRILFLNVLLLQNPNSLVRLELTTSYSIENLRDYGRRVEKEKSTTKQRQTPELEWVY